MSYLVKKIIRERNIPNKMLSEKTQKTILSCQSGKELYDRIEKAYREKKISIETKVESYALWLNNRKIRHDSPFMSGIIVDKETKKVQRCIIHNLAEPQIYWEKFDESVTTQSLKNEFQVAWNRPSSQLEKDTREVFEVKNKQYQLIGN